MADVIATVLNICGRCNNHLLADDIAKDIMADVIANHNNILIIITSVIFNIHYQQQWQKQQSLSITIGYMWHTITKINIIL